MSLIKDVKEGMGELKVNPKQLTFFVLIISSVLALIAWFYDWPKIFSCISIFTIVVMLLARLLNTKLLITPFKIWMALALILGWFVLRIILISVFVIMILPIGLIFKLTGKDLLQLSKKQSYWYKIKEIVPKSQYLKKF